MKNNNKVLSLLGLATKAGKIASGEFSTEKSVKSGKGFLVLVAADWHEIPCRRIFPVPLYPRGNIPVLRKTHTYYGIFSLYFRMRLPQPVPENLFRSSQISLWRILRWLSYLLLWQAPAVIKLYCCFSISFNSFFRSS